MRFGKKVKIAVACIIAGSMIIPTLGGFASAKTRDDEGDTKVRSYILDMDFEEDVDDVCALRIATTAMRDGDINLIGVAASVEAEGDPNLKAIHGVLCYDGLPDVAVGRGTHTGLNANSKYWAALSAYSDPAHYHPEDAFDMYTRLLEESEDKVTIITTGYLVNIAELIEKRPELVKEKVDHIYIVGGSEDGGWENNFFFTEEARKAAETVMTKAINIVQITLIPQNVGGPIKIGEKLIKAIPSDPVSQALVLSGNGAGRAAWYPMGTWAAIYGGKATRTKQIAAHVEIEGSGESTELSVDTDLEEVKQNCWYMQRTIGNLFWYQNKLDNLLLMGSQGFKDVITLLQTGGSEREQNTQAETQNPEVTPEPVAE